MVLDLIGWRLPLRLVANGGADLRAVLRAEPAGLVAVEAEVANGTLKDAVRHVRKAAVVASVAAVAQVLAPAVPEERAVPLAEVAASAVGAAGPLLVEPGVQVLPGSQAPLLVVVRWVLPEAAVAGQV